MSCRNNSKALSGVFILDFHDHRTAAGRYGDGVVARMQEALAPVDLLGQRKLAEIG